MGTALSILGLGGVAYWNRHALFKFLMITAVVMIICYVIVITTEMPEKHWPPVFMGGILAIGGIYIVEEAFQPKEQTWGDWFSSGWTGEEEAISDPRVKKPGHPDNPWRNGSMDDEGFRGGKRRTKQNKKHKARR